VVASVEDMTVIGIGIGSLDALVISAAAAADPAWRKQCGGDAHVVMMLACMMAQAAKDRSADYLAGSDCHPSLVYAAEAMAKTSIEGRLAVVRDLRLSLPHRAVAVGSVWGTTAGGHKNANGVPCYAGRRTSDCLLQWTGIHRPAASPKTEL
jgi:hypothetical protein